MGGGPWLESLTGTELELELIQPYMTQKPVLRGEVDARVLRVQVRSRVGGSGKRGKCNGLRCWRSKSLYGR